MKEKPGESEMCSRGRGKKQETVSMQENVMKIGGSKKKKEWVVVMVGG